MSKSKPTLQSLLTALILIFCTISSTAQKVGLVLSGGGAKGLSHIGVIKALEDNGIPISCVAGTSMGAIIAGLYSSGYSTDEMIRIINSRDFSDWISGNIDERYIYYFKEGIPNASWFNFKFDYDSIVLPSLIPTNIISPHQMDFAFMEIFSGAGAVAKNNFDSLFVPFRCVASDIAHNLAVVLKEGDLGSAVRASMTFPFYFKPIRINGTLMFDGGMYNNFPADVLLKEFDPDMIIGSKAVSNYAPPKDNNIISQLENMLMSKTDYSLICENSVLISPNLPKIGLLDFGESNTLIDSAYAATCRKIKEIRQFVYENVSKETITQRRQAFNNRKPPLIVDSVITSGLNKNQSQYLNKTLAHKMKRLSIEKLKPDFFKVIADDKIESMFPRLQYNELKKAYNLLLDVEKEKNTTVQFGGNISSQPINEAFFGLQYKYLGKVALTTQLNSYIGRFYSSAMINTRLDFPTRFPFFIESSLVFNQWDYFKTTTYFFEDKTPSYLVKNDTHLEAGLGIPMGNKGKLHAGIILAHLRDDYYQYNNFTRLDTTDETFFDFIAPYLCFEINSLNRKEFANRGIKIVFEARQVAGQESYTPGSTSLHEKGLDYKKWQDWYQFRGSYQNYFEHMGPVSLGFYSELLISSQSFFKNYTSSLLTAPAFEILPESRTKFLPAYRAYNYTAAGMQFVYSFFKNFDFRTEAYLFQPFRELIQQEDQTTKYGEWLSRRCIMGGSSFVLHSPFGPISISVNYYDTAAEKFSFIFNIGYIIFNKRALE